MIASVLLCLACFVLGMLARVPTSAEVLRLRETNRQLLFELHERSRLRRAERQARVDMQRQRGEMRRQRVAERHAHRRGGG